MFPIARVRALFPLVLALASANGVFAQRQDQSPPRGAPYTDIKAWHLRALGPELFSEDRLEIHRQLVRMSPYGERGLQQIFKNFEGDSAFDPHIPGIEENLRLLASGSPSQRKGAAREHLYATQAAGHAGFELIWVNQPVEGPDGKTDADLVLRHEETGMKTRVEVKEVKETSQRSDLGRLKRQIDIMAEEQLRDGIPRAWVNRKEAIPQIKEYAAERDVLLYDNVVTSPRNLRPGEMRFGDVLDDLSARIRWASPTRLDLAAGGVDAGFGVLMIAAAAPNARAELFEAFDAGHRTRDTFLRLGEHGAALVGGTALVASGAIRLAPVLSTRIALSSRWMAVGKWGGRAGWAVAILAEGFEAARWANGSITNRQFASSSASLGGAVAGGYGGTTVGAWIGGGIGCFFGPEGIPIGAGIGGWVGAAVGSAGGGYFGATAAEGAVNVLFERMNEKQQGELFDFLLEHYRLPSGAVNQ